LPKNDEGEFELVLGNRQLLSVFAIVVILLGVFFSMGYVVGRNSAPVGTETARNAKSKPEHDADSSDGSNPDTPTDTPANAATTPPAIEPAAGDNAPSSPPEITKPALAQQPAPAPVNHQTARSTDVKPKPSPSPAPAGPPVHAAAAGEPSSGQYWQVVATARPDAEIIAEALGKKGFHAILAPAPKDGIFRVLVGPLPDAPAQAQTRTGLESAGFKNPIMRKY
jgi:cell division septation protein DedD